MNDFRKNLNLGDSDMNEQNDEFSIFSDRILEDINPQMTFPNSGDERYFCKETNKILNQKRKKENENEDKKSNSKFTYDNLKRKSKHLVIESALDFINKKIKEAYNGNIGKGIIKKELAKLNQSQKKNSSAEFNQSFIHKTLKEILSQKITKKIKIYDEDHNKKLVEKLIEEKKDEFESLFNITFIDCLDHFIGKKQIKELNGLTLFNGLKEQILKEYKEDGESYYKNLEIFLNEYEQRINNAKPRKRKSKQNSKDE